MRILVAGSGAVGGYFGSLMHGGGLDVTFLARGKTLARLRDKGLTVREDTGEKTLPVKAVETVEGVFDLVFVSVKSRDTASVAEAFKGHLAEGGAVLTVQNGLGNAELLVQLLPGAHVLAGVAYIAADTAEPGVVVHTRKLAKIIFGEIEGEPSDASRRIEAALRGAGLDIRAEGGMAKRQWAKLAWNAGFNGVTALTGLGTGEAALHPEASRLIAQVMDEVAAVARAEGVEVSIDTAESLSWTSQFKGVRTSMLQDREAGRPLEVESIHGEAVRRAEALGIPVPATATVYRLLRASSALSGKIPPSQS